MHWSHFINTLLLSSFVSGWSLSIHTPTSEQDSNLFTMSEFEVENNTICKRKDFTNVPHDALDGMWCISLSNEQISYSCFTFLKGNLSKIIKGTLNLRVNDYNEVVNADYYPSSDTNELQIQLVQDVVELANIKPRLQIQGVSSHSLESGSEDQTTSKANSKQKGGDKEKYKNGNELEEKQPNQGSAELVFDEISKDDFIEIIKPTGLYGDNKTFIEQYWMYLLPPIIIMFIMSQLGPATQVEAKKTE